jgi:hypothetical protein
MQIRSDKTNLRIRYRLAKQATARAIRENKQLGLSDAEPPTEQEIAEETGTLDFSHWKSVPVA